MSDSLTQSEREMKRAEKACRAAAVLFEAQLFEDAVSRAYYTVLHAARAVLADMNIAPHHTRWRETNVRAAHPEVGQN